MSVIANHIIYTIIDISVSPDVNEKHIVSVMDNYEDKPHVGVIVGDLVGDWVGFSDNLYCS